jgi:hypothetical protein
LDLTTIKHITYPNSPKRPKHIAEKHCIGNLGLYGESVYNLG